MENTSGRGKLAEFPSELKGWNWGAFFLTWIWGLGNGTYIALLAWIPGVNIIMIFVLGANGNEWAWRNKHWDSIEHFRRVQKAWTVVSLCLVGAVALLMLLFMGTILTAINVSG